MIKHVVMWTVKGSEEGVDKAVALKTIKEKLDSLNGNIEGMNSLQVGINSPVTPESFDVCLITEHVSWEALTFYQDHPAHKEVAGYIGQVRKGRTVADFEF